jgi:hypothetical protein
LSYLKKALSINDPQIFLCNGELFLSGTLYGS